MIATLILCNTICQTAVAQERPGSKAYFDKTMKQVDQDMEGPRGQEARVICRRVAGITVPINTSIEAIRAGYSVDVATKFSDCVANYMYPVDARKSEELDRKAGRR